MKKCFQRLAAVGTIEKHWSPDVAQAAIEMLNVEGEHEAVERLRSFCVPVREEIHDILGYD